MNRIVVMSLLLGVLGAAVVLPMWTHISLITPARSQTNLPPPTDMPIPGMAPAPPPAAPAMPPATVTAPPAPPTALPLSSAAASSLPKPQQLDPSLKFTGAEGFIYDPTGRRDPFRPFFLKDQMSVPLAQQPPAPVAPAPEPEAPVVSREDTLQSFDVGQFRVVGVLWEVNDPKAMLRSPMGKVFLVRKQTRVGRHNGYVATIREGEVVVVELDRAANAPVTRVLTLEK